MLGIVLEFGDVASTVRCPQAPPLLLVDSMLLDSYGVGNGGREGEDCVFWRAEVLPMKDYCALPRRAMFSCQRRGGENAIETYKG